MWYLLCRSYLVWSSSTYWFLLLSFVLLLLYPKEKLLPRPMSRSFLLLFLLRISSRSFRFSNLRFKFFNPFQVNICEWWDVGVQFHYFACGYPVFTTPLVQQTVFPYRVCPWLSCQILVIVYVVAFFWVPYSVPFFYMSVLLCQNHIFYITGDLLPLLIGFLSFYVFSGFY